MESNTPREIIKFHLEAMNNLIESEKLSSIQKTVLKIFMCQITPRNAEEWHVFVTLYLFDEDFFLAMEMFQQLYGYYRRLDEFETA